MFFTGNADWGLHCSVCSARSVLAIAVSCASSVLFPGADTGQGSATGEPWADLSARQLLFPSTVQVNLNSVVVVPLSTACSRKHIVNSSN